MHQFSTTELAINGLDIKLKEELELKPAEPWDKAEQSESKRAKRLKDGADFWKFDELYFPQEMYSEGFSAPGKFHKDLLKISGKPGVHIILAARKHGKTATLKKIAVWKLLTGQIRFGGTLSSTLPISRNILSDIAHLILYNERLKYDYRPEFRELNADQLTIRVPGKRFESRLMAFSENRSVRGASYRFDRPQFILCDDMETRQSSLGAEQTLQRKKIIGETAQSMSESGTLIVLGNNFDERCAMNSLKLDFEERLLPYNWKVYIFPAWKGRKGLWPERFPAKNESDLRLMLKPLDESEWQGDFLQAPTPPEGFFFKRESLVTFKRNNLPKDARGVLYCDPNLAKKGRGDSTAITSLLYSPEADKYYVDNGACRSFSDSNDVLATNLRLKGPRHRVVGFDGNVSQESTWTMHIRNFCRINSIHYPVIKWCKYHVDELAKNIQSVWAEGRLLISEEFLATDDGRRYLAQLLSFQGKKANKADDAPDSLISAFELIHERHLGKKTGSVRQPVVVFDTYL